jgi:hypothetical protein
VKFTQAAEPGGSCQRDQLIAFLNIANDVVFVILIYLNNSLAFSRGTVAEKSQKCTGIPSKFSKVSRVTNSYFKWFLIFTQSVGRHEAVSVTWSGGSLPYFLGQGDLHGSKEASHFQSYPRKRPMGIL